MEEKHLGRRAGWLRAAMLGADDGIVSVSSLLIGVAASSASNETILIAAVAGLVAGAMSIALYAAALPTIGGLLFTMKAAPIMLSVCHLGDDPVALQRAFDGFEFWGWWRGVCQCSAYLASFWALLVWTGADPTPVTLR